MAKGKGTVSKIAVWILLGFLFVGLAGFGVGSFGGTVRSVATIGETDVSVNAYGRALQAELRGLAEARGSAVSFAEAQGFGLDRQVLQGLLAEAALNEAARRAGLSVGDARVAREIQNIPAFRGVDGSFDREGYAFTLERNGLSVAEFEEQIRSELGRNILQAALVNGLAPQPAFADAIYEYLATERSVSLVRRSAADLSAPVAEPDDAAVAAFHEANPDAFRRPARSEITYVWLTPNMAAATMEVDEAALRAAYEDRREDFVRPARRFVERLGFADEAAAQAAADAIAAGETDFDALLAERGLTPEDVDLGIVEERDLDAAGAGVFALEDTGVAGPLPSLVGPALFRVNAILTAQETGFEEAREDLRAEVARARAEAMIADEIEPLEDRLAGGATLEDLAAESDLDLGTLTWTGAEDGGIADYAAFRDAAARARVGDFPEIALLEDGGIFALRVDTERPSDIPPLDEVRDAARTLAREAATAAALRAEAEAAVAALEGGASFEDAGLGAARSLTGITRARGTPDLPDAALEAVFALAQGAVALVEDGADLLILRLDTVTPPPRESAEATALRAALSQQAAQSIAQDLLGAVARSVEAEVGITVNQTALNAVHSQLQ